MAKKEVAKKEATPKAVETPKVETSVELHPEDKYKVEQPKVEEVATARKVLDDLKKKHKQKSSEFELKDRMYYLIGNR